MFDNLYARNRSRSLFHGEAASSSIESAGLAYQSPSLLAAGGKAGDVALLSVITNLIFTIFLVRLPYLANSSDHLKKIIIVLASCSVLAWLPLIILPLVYPDIPVTIMIALWVLNVVPSMLIVPLRDKWVSDILPAGKVGRYFGIRQIAAASAYIGSFYTMGYLLDRSVMRIHSGFSIVFFVALIAAVISLIVYISLKVPVKLGQIEDTNFGMLDFIYEIKKNSIGSVLIFVTLMTFASSISSAFYSVYMLQDLRFSYLTYTIIISVEYLARISSLFLWGKFIDNAGAVKVLRVISFAIPVMPVLWLLSAHMGYLVFIQILSGLAWAAFDLGNQSYICSASPEPKRLQYIVYQRCIITLASAAGPLCGALLLSRVFQINGSPILSIFLISGILRMMVAAVFSFRLKSIDNAKEELGFDSAAVNRFLTPVKVNTYNGEYPRYRRDSYRYMPETGEQGVGQGLLYNPESRLTKTQNDKKRQYITERYSATQLVIRRNPEYINEYRRYKFAKKAPAVLNNGRVPSTTFPKKVQASTNTY